MQKFCNKQKLEKISASGLSDKCWFILNDNRFLFKADSKFNNCKIEVFVSFLFDKLKIQNFVNYDFAMNIDSNILGSCCKNFKSLNMEKVLPFNEILVDIFSQNNSVFGVSYKEEFDNNKYEDIEHLWSVFEGEQSNSIELVMDTLTQYANKNNFICDTKTIQQDLYKMIILDYFLCNSDRHMGNIEFVITNKDNVKELKLAPLFDFGLYFNFLYYFVLYPQEYREQATDFTKLRTGISNAGIIHDFSNNKYLKDLGIVVADFHNIVQANSELKNLFQILQKMDLASLIQEFESKTQQKFSPNLREHMILSYQSRISRIMKFEKDLDKRKVKDLQK